MARIVEQTRLTHSAPILLVPVRFTRRKNLELALASLAALGNVRTETLQAFTDKEFEAILKA